MKKQASVLVAVLASFAIGQASAGNYGGQYDNRNPNQYNPNNNYSTKVKQNQNQEDFARTVDMNYKTPQQSQKAHPIFQDRMGDH